MLRLLRYRNFKSWQDTGTLKLAPITGFFGANSSGKTSLLQGLLLLKQTTESSDRNQIFDFGDESKYVDLGSLEEAIFGHAPGALAFELAWTLPQNLQVQNPENPNHALFGGNEMAFQTEVEWTEKKGNVVRKVDYGLGPHHFSLFRKNGNADYGLDYQGENAGFRFLRQDGRKWPIPAPLKFYGFPDQIKAYYRNAGFLSDFQFELEKLFQRTYYLGPLRENPKRQYTWKGAEPDDMGRRGQRAVDAILVSDNRGRKISPGHKKKKVPMGEYIALKLKELGLIHSFQIRQIQGSSFYQVWVRQHPQAAEVLITDVGFGVSQILPVITLCFYVPEGSIVIVEQPEIHLHPSVQAGLADVFVDAIKNRGIQIILESHSEHLLRRLQRRLAEEALTPEDLSLYFCDASNGQSEIKPLQVDEFGTINNWPRNFFGDEFSEIAAMNLAKIQRQKRP
jgi:predicted ATPase